MWWILRALHSASPPWQCLGCRLPLPSLHTFLDHVRGSHKVFFKAPPLYFRSSPGDQPDASRAPTRTFGGIDSWPCTFFSFSRSRPASSLYLLSFDHALNRLDWINSKLVCSNYYILSCKCLLPQRMFLLPNNLQMYSNEICLRCWIFASACICQLTLKTKLIHVPIARKLIPF